MACSQVNGSSTGVKSFTLWSGCAVRGWLRFRSAKSSTRPMYDGGVSFSRSISLISPSPPKYKSICSAALRPAAMASMTDFVPVTASPAAYTPSWLVRWFSSASIYGPWVSASPICSVSSGFCPTANMTYSTGITWFVPSSSSMTAFLFSSK